MRGGGGVALTYLAFFILAPQTIYYAQELRSYGMLFGLSSILCALYFLIREHLYNRFQSPRILAYLFVLQGIAAILVLTHYYSYVFVFSLGCALLFEAIMKKKLVLPTLIGFIIVGLVGVGWIVLHCYVGGFYERIVGASSGESWVYEGSLLRFMLGFLSGSFSKYGCVLVIFIFAYFAFTQSKLFFEKFKCHFALLVPVIIEVIIVSLMFIFLTKTITQRYLMELYPFVYLFVALVLAGMGKHSKITILLLVICLAGYSFVMSKTYKKEDIRAASVYVQEHFNPQECKLPVGWISYARYLPAFEFIERPLVQENCDLILLSASNEEDANEGYPRIHKHLAQYGIVDGYEILDFDAAAVVVVKKREQ